ncbi:uncharacterized protein METZ01_LOCUS95589, partial [marine metagenome]
MKGYIIFTFKSSQRTRRVITDSKYGNIIFFKCFRFIPEPAGLLDSSRGISFRKEIYYQPLASIIL